MKVIGSSFLELFLASDYIPSWANSLAAISKLHHVISLHEMAHPPFLFWWETSTTTYQFFVCSLCFTWFVLCFCLICPNYGLYLSMTCPTALLTCRLKIFCHVTAWSYHITASLSILIIWLMLINGRTQRWPFYTCPDEGLMAKTHWHVFIVAMKPQQIYGFSSASWVPSILPTI